MSDPTLELNRAIFAAVRAWPALVAMFPAGVPIHDGSPPGLDPGDGEAGYPFIRAADYDVAKVGEPLRDRAGEIFDDPADETATLHVFARGARRNVIARTISDHLAEALAAELPIEDGQKIVLGQMIGSRHFSEADGLTAHSVITFQFHIEPEG